MRRLLASCLVVILIDAGCAPAMRQDGPEPSKQPVQTPPATPPSPAPVSSTPPATTPPAAAPPSTTPPAKAPPAPDARPAPPAEGTVSAPPFELSLLRAELHEVRGDGTGGSHLQAVSPGGVAVVGPGEVFLRLFLAGPLDERRAEAAVVATGLSPDLRQWQFEPAAGPRERLLTLRFPPGPAGQEWSVEVKGAGIIRIRRAEPVRVAYEVVGHGELRLPLPGGRTVLKLPATSPLTVRLRFDQDVDRGSVEESLRRRLLESVAPGRSPEEVKLPVEFSWSGPRALEVGLPRPPASFRLDPSAGRARNGLVLWDAPPLPVRLVAEREIWAVRPDGSAPRRLGATTIDVESGLVSPDGRYLALLEPGDEGGHGAPPRHTWVMRLGGGEAVDTGRKVGEDPPLAWFPGAGRPRLLVGAGVHDPATGAYEALPAERMRWAGVGVSRDGSRLAYAHVIRSGGYGEPADLELQVAPLDPGGAPDVRVPLTSPPVKGELPPVPIVWLPDGKAVITQDYDAERQARVLVVIDVPGGRKRPVPGDAFARDRRFGGFALSPDGRRLAIGELLLDLADGGIERIDTGIGEPSLRWGAVVGWSPDGRHVLYQQRTEGPGAWMPSVVVYDTVQGRARELAKGVALGWLPGGELMYAAERR